VASSSGCQPQRNGLALNPLNDIQVTSLGRVPLLNQAHILVVEDEPFIALPLALAIEDAGGVVVGPAGSVKEALALLQSTQVSAAILDVNVADGDITPVLEILVKLGTPLIVQTGVGLPEGFPPRIPPIEFASSLALRKSWSRNSKA
jgi:CheY-like chemotaxis protein